MATVKYILIFLGFTVLSCGCGHTNFTKQDEKKMENLQEFLSGKQFEAVFDHASPKNSRAFNQAVYALKLSSTGNTAGFIDLTGNYNYFKMDHGTVSAVLPFYGERYFSSRFGDEGTIEFKGVPQNYTLTRNTKKHLFRLEFTITDREDQGEQYKIAMVVYQNHKVSLYVKSAQRSAIRYTGKLEEIRK